MPSRFLFVLPLLFTATSSIAQNTILIDEAHSQLQQEQIKSSPAVYSVSAGSTITVDAVKYEFKMPDQLRGKTINQLQVILSSTQQYATGWDQKAAKVNLTPETLIPLRGSTPFKSFSRGQQIVIAIGNFDGTRFNVVWVGMAQVK